MDVPMKLEFAETVVTLMTGNPRFISPFPELPDVIEAINALRNAYQLSLGGSTIHLAAARIREKELDFVMTQLGAYVQSQCGGDEEVIRSSGFDIHSINRVKREVTQPQALKAIISAYPGRVSLRWKAIAAARTYFVEQSIDGSTNWIQCGTCTTANIEIPGLPSTTYLWFRVSAIGVSGTSPASDAVKALIG